MRPHPCANPECHRLTTQTYCHARMTDQFKICEVTRLCTPEIPNICSFLYSACARVAREMGFEKIQTFILETETGISLRASGWTLDGSTGGGTWNRPSRDGRRDDQPQCAKQRWIKQLRKSGAVA